MAVPRAALLGGGALAAVLVLGYGGSFLVSGDKVPRGVHVAGIDLSGRTETQARTILNRELADDAGAPLQLVADDVQLRLVPATAGLRVDVQEAQLLGHEGNNIWLGNGLIVTDGQRPVLVRVGSRIHRDKLLARHLGHGCEHAFVLDTARLQLLLDHPLAARCEFGSRWGLLAAAGCSDRDKKQILRDDSH